MLQFNRLLEDLDLTGAIRIRSLPGGLDLDCISFRYPRHGFWGGSLLVKQSFVIILKCINLLFQDLDRLLLCIHVSLQFFSILFKLCCLSYFIEDILF